MEKAQAERVGTKIIASSGMEMTCIAYRRSDDIDVQFEDGSVVRKKTWASFCRGQISNPNVPRSRALRLNMSERIGAKSIASNGMEMTCIAYRNAKDIDIQFSDGTVVEHKAWAFFRKGYIRNPNRSTGNLKTDGRVGVKKQASNGMQMTCIAYRRSDDIDVQFADDTIVKNKTWDAFCKGQIRNPSLSIQPTTRQSTRKKKTNKSLTDRVGTKAIGANRMEMVCIAYRGVMDIDVQFQDGTIVQHKRWDMFLKGYIRNPNETPSMTFANERVGAKSKASNGMMMTCIAYRRSYDIDIQFEDGVIVEHKTWTNFCKGNILNPDKPTRKRKT